MHIRAFFSIELPKTAKEEINKQLINKLKKAIHHPALRWTKEKNLHITLQFLGQLDALDVNDLIKNVKNELEHTPPFYLELGQLELFPTLYKARVITLSVGPTEILLDLAKKVSNGIIKTQYPIEMRPYRGHLTLARLTHPHPTPLSLSDIAAPHFDKILIDEVILYRSEPAENGSHYTELAKLPLRSQD